MVKGILRTSIRCKYQGELVRTVAWWNLNQSNCSDQSQTTGSSANQYEFGVTKQRQARENARVQLAIGFGFASHWLGKWHEICQPITERSKVKPKQTRITFDTQLKTVLQSKMSEASWIHTSCPIKYAIWTKKYFKFHILLPMNMRWPKLSAKYSNPVCSLYCKSAASYLQNLQSWFYSPLLSL